MFSLNNFFITISKTMIILKMPIDITQEACYRFNRRYWGHQLFDRLLFACTLGKPITRDRLLAISAEKHPELCQ